MTWTASARSESTRHRWWYQLRFLCFTAEPLAPSIPAIERPVVSSWCPRHHWTSIDFSTFVECDCCPAQSAPTFAPRTSVSPNPFQAARPSFRDDKGTSIYVRNQRIMNYDCSQSRVRVLMIGLIAHFTGRFLIAGIICHGWCTRDLPES